MRRTGVGALHADRGAVGGDLGHVAPELVAVEAHRDDGVRACLPCRVSQALDRLEPAVGQHLRVALHLAADEALEARADVRADVPAPHGEPEHLPVHLRDAVAGQVVHRRDDHVGHRWLLSEQLRGRDVTGRRNGQHVLERLVPNDAAPQGQGWQSGGMATMQDLDELALAMPQSEKHVSDDGRPTYSVHGKFFCFHRSRRPDAVDPETGERLDDVLVFRVADLGEKEIMLADDRGVFFTTPHWNGYSAVLMRIPSLERIDRDELRDLVAEAWLTRAQKRVAKAWLAEHGIDEERQG